MKPAKRTLFLATLAGFLAGCAIGWLVRPRGGLGPTISVIDSPPATKQTQTRTQPASVAKSPEAAAQNTQAQPAPRGAEARRVLNEIKRDKVADVNIRFFATTNGKLSQQFIDFFELTPAEAGKLSDLIQTTRTEMWKAANAQAQVSRTATGGVVVKIPPAVVGPDIYDKVMDGFQSVLGDDRFNDMMLYNDDRFGGQFETLFNQFGGEDSTVTIEPTDNGHYNIVIKRTIGGGGFTTQTVNDCSADGIKKYWPEYEEFIPAKEH